MKKNEYISVGIMIMIMIMIPYWNGIVKNYENKKIMADEAPKLVLGISSEKDTVVGEEFQVEIQGQFEAFQEIIIPEGILFLGEKNNNNSNVEVIKSEGDSSIQIINSKESTKDEILILSFTAEESGVIKLFSQVDTEISNSNVLELEIKNPVETQEYSKVKEDTLQREEVSVGTWADFVLAITNINVSEITVATDLIRGTGAVLPAITRDIKINGNNHMIDFGVNNGTITLGARKEPGNLEMNNLIVKKSGSTAIVYATKANSTNWKVELSNIKGDATNQSGFIEAPEAAVVVNAGALEYDLTTSNNVIIAKQFKVTNGARIISNVEQSFYKTESTDSNVEINGHSYVKLYSEKGIAMSMDARSSFNVRGKGTLLEVEGNSSATGDSGAVMNFIGDNTIINISDEAEVSVYSKRTVAVLMNSKGGVFNVSRGAKLKLRSDNNMNNLGATLRFRIAGNMTFNVTEKAEIDIQKTGGNAAAVRMYGTDNKFNVESGGRVNIRNMGSGKPTDGGGDGRNQGIHFSGDKGVFDLKGKGSQVKIQAESGPAVDMQNYTGEIVAREGTVFIAEGHTNTINSGIFNTGVSTIDVDKPLFYDFRNNRVGGGNVFDVSRGSKFTSNSSDLSVWKKGDNLEGNPYLNWSLFSYVLSGANFVSIDSTNVPEEFNTNSDSYGSNGASSYSRMSGNNAAPIVDELRVPTNADKSIFGHVTIPVGNEEGRDAWTDEAYVVIKVSNSDGSSKEYTGTTIGMDNSSAGLEIYGEDARAGMYQIKLPNEMYLESGSKLEVITAWRGTADPESGRNHFSEDQQLTAPDRTVVDVIPPQPVELTNKINNATKQIHGKNVESNSELTVSINGVLLDKSIKIDSSGEWTFNLPYYLEKNDVVQVFLRNQAGFAEGVNNPPVTNNEIGNINPSEDYKYHDAIFKACSKSVVADILPDKNTVEKIVEVNNENDETFVGSILTYTLTIKNAKDDNIETEWADVTLSDTLDEGLDLDEKSIHLNGEILQQGEYSYDDEHRVLRVPVGNISTGETAKVVFSTKVNINAKDKIIKNKGIASGWSPREAVFIEGENIPGAEKEKILAESNTVDNPGGTVTGGLLEFISAPSKLSFGKLKLLPNSKQYSLADFDSSLEVLDNRISGFWTMVARVQRPMTSATGNKLIGSLHYYIGGVDNEMTTEALRIYSEESREESVVISDSWEQKRNGPMLDVRSGQATEETYSGIIEWELQDVPGNDKFLGDL